VAGNFHFAPGRSFQQGSMHVHDMAPFANQKLDFSHTVNKLSFGKPYPGMQNPLDAVSFKQVRGSCCSFKQLRALPARASSCAPHPHPARWGGAIRPLSKAASSGLLLHQGLLRSAATWWCQHGTSPAHWAALGAAAPRTRQPQAPCHHTPPKNTT
jgi:hypothetical protein